VGPPDTRAHQAPCGGQVIIITRIVSRHVSRPAAAPSRLCAQAGPVH
jgi:hypothetical protein